MKKLVTAACALVAASAFAVESANVVGYTTKTLAAGQYGLAAIQFQTTDSQTANLQDLISCSVATASYDEQENFHNDWYQSAAQIQIRSGTGWLDYYYCADAYLAVNGTEDWVPGWANSGATYVQDRTIAPGTGIWLIGPSGSSADFTVAGQVVGTATANLVTGSGYNLVANPFPEAFDLNTDKITWGFSPVASYDEQENFHNDWYQSAPQIQIRSGTGWLDYYYCADAYLAVNGTEDWVPGWANSGATYVQNRTIDVGEGFWVIDGAGTTVVTK